MFPGNLVLLSAVRHVSWLLRGGIVTALTMTAFASLAAHAQVGLHAIPAARNLVIAAVDTAQAVALPGNRPVWAVARRDLGAVAADLPMSNLVISLNRTREREQAFQQLLKDQQDPASADYHHWLTPSEIGERFGASQHDIDAVSAWLASRGLRVDAVANGRTRLRFSGSAQAIQATFATPLHDFSVGTDTRIANTADPQIPVALAPSIAAVSGLHTDRLRPANRMQARERSALGPLQPAASNCSGGACSFFVFPADFAKIYDLPSTYNGSGQSIAIVSRTRIYDTDNTNFMALGGVTFTTPIVIVPPAGADPGSPVTVCPKINSDKSCDISGGPTIGDQGEATLDVQRAGSVAPGATLKLIASKDPSKTADGIVTGIEYSIDNDPLPAQILSISYASCESENGRSPSLQFDQLFQQAAAEGISVFVASGDGGVAGCEALDETPGTTQTISTNTLCASSYVTCVGGTEFADKSNPTAYWASSNSSHYLSALGYIPEGAWNEALDSTGATQFASTGGGVSAYIATPAWQTGTGVPGTQGRYTPDMSFGASTREGYLTCLAAQNASCDTSTGTFRFLASGGTSASTPSMAGVTALLNQKLGASQGNLNPRLYALAATPANGVFHDITVATSGVAGCDVAVPSPCNNSTPGPNGLAGGLQGFLVGSGYDLATGLGSIDIANFLSQWNSSMPSVFNLDQHGLTGAWYNAATSGQGFLIEAYRDLQGAGKGYLAIGWYTFDPTASSGQRWYTLQGPANQGDASSSLAIYASTGGNFNAPPKLGAAPQVGNATLSFSDCANGSLTYAFNDGRKGTIPITRIDPNITCSPSGDDDKATQNYLLSGAWYDTATSGQGFFFDVNPVINLMFAAWYTYAPNGAAIGGGASQRWYTIQDNAFTAATRSKSGLSVYETTGGAFNTGKVSPGPAVGTVDLTINNCSSMTLSYTFTAGTNAGKSGTIALGRVVGAPAGCMF